MRLELLFSPRLLCERLAIESQRRRRLARLRGTVAAGLSLGHIDSLELLDLLQADPPRVIYDIGSNIGTWTLLAKANFPDAEIHAFEPLEGPRKKFKELQGKIAGVSLHPVALGEKSCQLDINVTSLNDASSFLPIGQAMHSIFGVTKIGEQRVDVVQLDGYRRDHSLPTPDLIKLDVQGYELEVLAGAEETLDGVKAIVIEVSFVELYGGQPLFSDVTAWMSRHGFELRALGVNTVLGGALVQTDVLFVRRDRTEHM